MVLGSATRMGGGQQLSSRHGVAFGALWEERGLHLDHDSARAPHTVTRGVWLSIQPLRIIQKLLCHCKITCKTSIAQLNKRSYAD